MKKIKDLTQEEEKTICDKYMFCDKCPLGKVIDGRQYCIASYKHLKTIFNENELEKEIDEK